MESYERWGSLCPTTTGEEILYTVPENKALIVSTLIVTNIGAGTPTFRIGISADGTAGNAEWIYHDSPLTAKETRQTCMRITVQEDLIISVVSSVANEVTFQLFGALIDQN